MIHIKIGFIQLTKPSLDRVRSAFFGVLGIVAIWVQTRKGIQRQRHLRAIIILTLLLHEALNCNSDWA